MKKRRYEIRNGNSYKTKYLPTLVKYNEQLAYDGMLVNYEEKAKNEEKRKKRVFYSFCKRIEDYSDIEITIQTINEIRQFQSSKITEKKYNLLIRTLYEKLVKRIISNNLAAYILISSIDPNLELIDILASNKSNKEKLEEINNKIGFYDPEFSKLECDYIEICFNSYTSNSENHIISNRGETEEVKKYEEKFKSAKNNLFYYSILKNLNQKIASKQIEPSCAEYELIMSIDPEFEILDIMHSKKSYQEKKDKIKQKFKFFNQNFILLEGKISQQKKNKNIKTYRRK